MHHSIEELGRKMPAKKYGLAAKTKNRKIDGNYVMQRSQRIFFGPNLGNKWKDPGIESWIPSIFGDQSHLNEGAGPACCL